ncbi:CaiB/BaiF CoA transferase family protein [Chloroflexota bacterium]
MEKIVLDGVKILDLSWSLAGPMTITYLADFGATVVHVESKTRPDVIRRSGPYVNNEPHPDKSGIFLEYNRSKYGMTLDLNKPAGLEVARRLVAWADIFAESFVPGVISRWGLDYESVKKIKPDIIYLSSSPQGQTGPEAKQRAFGYHLSSLSGFNELTGWPDRAPSGIYTAYTDVIAPKLQAAAIMAALDYRRRTGIGCYIDSSQVEGGSHFLAPLFLDYAANGNSATRTGNRSDYAAPHGAYPCKSEERWITIAVFNSQEWTALCEVMGSPDLAEDHRFSTLLARKQHEDELDAIINKWTGQHTAEKLMEELQGIGVAAGVVQTYEDLFNDPQLNHRGHYVNLEHSSAGRYACDGIPVKLSKTPGGPRFAAPCYGEHNEYVLKEILAYSDEEIADLVSGGALE